MGVKDFFNRSNAKNCSIPVGYRIDVATHCGNERGENEDNFSLNGRMRNQDEDICAFSEFLPSPLLLNVCDGMGGEQDGRLASEIAADSSKKLLDVLSGTAEDNITDMVNSYVQDANNKICEMLKNNNHCRGGSTFAMAYLRDNMVYPFSLGDSRIYKFFDGALEQVTTDNTVAMNKYRMNIYTLEEAEASIDSHKLTLFLGVDVRGNGLNAESYPAFEWKEGMKLLICSDGLYDMCSRAQISEILGAEQDNYASALLDMAMRNGGIDNITCMVVER